RLDKADEAYRQALAIQQKQAAAYPEAPEYQFALAKTYSALGLAQNSNQPEIAVTMCQQAQDILSKLVHQYPGESEYKSLLAATQLNLGQAYVTRGWHDKAEPALKEAVGIYEESVRAEPDPLPDDQESLGRSHTILGIVYRHTNHTEKAEEEQQQA